MKSRSILLLCCCLLVASSPLYGQDPNVPEQAVLMPGDRLELSIWRNAELSGTYTVAPDGSLLHPLFREIRLTQVPISEAESRMRMALRNHLSEPEFTFMPLHRVYVGGNVRIQGEY